MLRLTSVCKVPWSLVLLTFCMIQTPVRQQSRFSLQGTFHMHFRHCLQQCWGYWVMPIKMQDRCHHRYWHLSIPCCAVHQSNVYQLERTSSCPVHIDIKNHETCSFLESSVFGTCLSFPNVFRRVIIIKIEIPGTRDHFKILYQMGGLPYQNVVVVIQFLAFLSSISFFLSQ